MHEATVTIIEIKPPTNPKGPFSVRVDDGTGKPLKLKAWANSLIHHPTKWRVGDTFDFTWESEDKVWNDKPYQEHTIRTAQPHPTSERANGRTALLVAPVSIGPHLGMWEKRVSELLESGMGEEGIILHIIESRRIARKGLETNIDAKLPEPPSQADFDDTLEF